MKHRGERWAALHANQSDLFRANDDVLDKRRLPDACVPVENDLATWLGKLTLKTALDAPVRSCRFSVGPHLGSDRTGRGEDLLGRRPVLRASPGGHTHHPIRGVVGKIAGSGCIQRCRCSIVAAARPPSTPSRVGVEVALTRSAP